MKDRAVRQKLRRFMMVGDEYLHPGVDRGRDLSMRADSTIDGDQNLGPPPSEILNGRKR